MDSRWSLRQYESGWREERCAEASLSDTKLAIEILDGEGDTITVTAASPDGVRYTGDYHYREGSYSDGEVLFERYKAPCGDVLVGEWWEVGRTRYAWIIRVGASGG